MSTWSSQGTPGYSLLFSFVFTFYGRKYDLDISDSYLYPKEYTSTRKRDYSIVFILLVVVNYQRKTKRVVLLHCSSFNIKKFMAHTPIRSAGSYSSSMLYPAGDIM